MPHRMLSRCPGQSCNAAQGSASFATSAHEHAFHTEKWCIANSGLHKSLHAVLQALNVQTQLHLTNRWLASAQTIIGSSSIAVVSGKVNALAGTLYNETPGQKFNKSNWQMKHKDDEVGWADAWDDLTPVPLLGPYPLWEFISLSKKHRLHALLLNNQ